MSQSRIAFIKQWEGVRNRVYLDVAGNPTVGVGHLLTKQEALKYANTVMSVEQIDALLKADLRKVDNDISRFVTVPLNDDQYTAVSSFIFNLGAAAFQRSTLRMRINRSEDPSEQWARWCWAGSHRIRGLLLRRLAERNLFMGIRERK